MEFYEILKELRKSRQISQAKLAEYLDVTPGAIGMYESGKRKPSYEMLEAIADFFNVDIDYLIGREVTSTYILDPEAASMLQVLSERPELKVMLDSARTLEKEDVEAVIRILELKK